MENSIKINASDYSLSLNENVQKTVDSKLLKKESLKKLSGNWTKAFFIVFLKIFFMLLSLGLSIVSLYLTNDNNIIFKYVPLRVLNVFATIKNFNKAIPFLAIQIFSGILYLFSIPLNYGILRWFYTLAKEGAAKISVIFFYYRSIKSIFKTFLFELVMWSRFILWGSVLLLPGFILFIFSCVKMQTANENRKLLFSLAILGMIIFFICGVFFFIKFAAKYFLMPFLQVTNDENIFKNTKFVIKIMNALEDYFGKVFFSFFLWLPFQSLVLPMFFIFPYTTMIMFVAINKKLI